jgi:peroxiredoxin
VVIPKVGVAAPLFTAQDQDGKAFNLADQAGNKLILLILPIGE